MYARLVLALLLLFVLWLGCKFEAPAQEVQEPAFGESSVQKVDPAPTIRRIIVPSPTSVSPGVTPTSIPEKIQKPEMRLKPQLPSTPVIQTGRMPIQAPGIEDLKVRVLWITVIPRANEFGIADLKTELIPSKFSHFPNEPFLLVISIVEGKGEFPLGKDESDNFTRTPWHVEIYGKQIWMVEAKQIIYVIDLERTTHIIRLKIPIIKAVDQESIGFKFSIEMAH